jgi:hypothetical protein
MSELSSRITQARRHSEVGTELQHVDLCASRDARTSSRIHLPTLRAIGRPMRCPEDADERLSESGSTDL